MKFKNTTEALYIQAKEILDAIAKIGESEDTHTIELDLMLEKLRNIYDLVNDMKDSISGEIGSEMSDTLELGSEKELTPEPETEKLSEDNSGKDIITEEKEIKMESSKTNGPEEASYVSDRFKTSKPTLNEEMEGKSQKENLSSQLNLTPINSISGAIGLNEKFELINELFDGDKDKFESTLEILNKANSFVEAYNYLNDNFDWDMDSVYVQRILELIRRKLIVRRNEQ
jgi:hypothetical protein